jgi:hypothetical protein
VSQIVEIVNSIRFDKNNDNDRNHTNSNKLNYGLISYFVSILIL